MKGLINNINDKYFIKLGEYRFSPIMEATAGLSLEYCDLFKNGNVVASPLFFCFPEKKGASLWTTISILNNYFFEDYIDNEVEGIDFKRGDKVKIYNCIAKIEKIKSNKVTLRFKDQGGMSLNERLNSELSLVNSERSLSLFKNYRQKSKEARINRNSISKILVPNYSETINHNNLDSKVLLVSGRGNQGVFRDLLRNIEIYNEPLSKIYPENKNIIIKPDLGPYKDVFSQDKIDEIDEFKKWLNILLNQTEIEEIKFRLIELNNLLSDKSKITHQFDCAFKSFISDYEKDVSKITHLRKKYPGYKEIIPKKLRAIIINDVNQIYHYPNTISGFLKLKIPVIFISNRNVEKTNELEFYSRLFSDNPEYYRVNWNITKVKALRESITNDDFLDKELWRQCERYSSQKIEISISEKNELDNVISRLQKQIMDLDSFVILQKSFYDNFYPALYALKNSKESNDFIKELIRSFKKDFDQVKYLGINSEIKDSIENSINIALKFDENNKQYGSDHSLFSNLLSSSSSKFYIPIETKKINIPNSNTERITFSGYPYLEYAGKFLLNAICVDFVPETKLVCWPFEASLTHKYIYKRLLAGYFCDYLNDIPFIPDEYLLLKQADFENEINSYLITDTDPINDDDQEGNLEYLHTFKYKGFANQSYGNSSFKVKCDILNFDDGSFMFLPKNGNILAEVEDYAGQIKIKNSKFNELSIGYKIFKYKKDRGAYRKISRQNMQIKNSFSKLDFWKEALEKAYSISDNNIDKLEQLLFETKRKYRLSKGNPIKSNIQRWLFDNEVIKPDKPNLRIIFHSIDIGNIDKQLNDLEDAYNRVNSYTIGLSSNIKRNISKQLFSRSFENNDFIVTINGSRIKVETRTITSLDKNEIEIDYHNTRKIIC